METAIAFQIRQFRRATFSAVHNDRCALIRVQTGHKRVKTDQGLLEIAAGSLAVMAPFLSMTIENNPSNNAPYCAQLLVLPDSLVQSVRSETGHDGDPLRVTRQEQVLAAFDRAVAYSQDRHVPERLKRHAVREVLLWLAEEGIGFGRLRLPSVADRLRTLISSAPDHDWRSADASRALAVSEPTLRRHLAADDTSFTELLADIRMGVALTLLQTSELPVNRIALDVGYACPSRFAARFRKRFGLSPSSIRSHDPYTEISLAS